MKPSGKSWLGRVPEAWMILPNRALFGEIKDRGHESEEMLSVLISRGVIRQSALIEDSSKKDGSNQDRSKYKLVVPGDIVYNKMRAWQGAIGASELRGIVSPAYVVIRSRAVESDSRYFHYLFRTPSFAAEAQRWSYGITSDQWSLRPEQFKEIYCCVPPISEQKDIVAFLDHADRQIQRYIRAKRKLIALLNEQKQATIDRAVSRGLDPSVRLKPSGLEWLGDVPENWEVKKLRFLFRYVKGRRAGDLTNEYIGKNPGSYPVYSGQTEDQGIMGYIDSYEFDFSSPVIFVSTVGARAMSTRLVHGRFSLSQNCALIIPRTSDVHPLFYENVFQRLFANERASISLIMQPSLRFSDLNRFYVPHPPVTEQAEIARYLAHASGDLDRAVTSATREIGLLQEFRTRLICDVVTGKVDVREAAVPRHDESEPAESLDEAENMFEIARAEVGGDDHEVNESVA